MIKAGYYTIDPPRGQNPEDIYTADCLARGMPVDQCALYSYRLAVHYVDHDGQLPENGDNWWNWKNRGRFNDRSPSVGLGPI